MNEETQAPMPLELQPPGPGVWQLDITHWSRPMTRFSRDGFCEAFTQGQRDWMSRYGAPLASIQARHETVSFFNDSKGYGFIRDSETKESIFVHINNVVVILILYLVRSMQGSQSNLKALVAFNKRLI